MTKTIVILHGWQSKIDRWDYFKKKLTEKGFLVYLPLLPGFGINKLTLPHNLTNYCLWLKKYFVNNKIKRPILIGHSNGGRIAIKYVAEQGNIDKLILIASAGIKPKITFKKIIGLFLAKTGKILFSFSLFSMFKRAARWLLYQFLRESDYYQADDILKKTMINILNEDLKDKLKDIKVPTLICWGEKDKSTPIADAYLIKKRINKSTLLTWENVGHGLPFEKKDELLTQIISFCQK